jgi:hypothetical protein
MNRYHPHDTSHLAHKFTTIKSFMKTKTWPCLTAALSALVTSLILTGCHGTIPDPILTHTPPPPGPSPTSPHDPPAPPPPPLLTASANHAWALLDAGASTGTKRIEALSDGRFAILWERLEPHRSWRLLRTQPFVQALPPAEDLGAAQDAELFSLPNADLFIAWLDAQTFPSAISFTRISTDPTRQTPTRRWITSADALDGFHRDDPHNPTKADILIASRAQDPIYPHTSMMAERRETLYAQITEAGDIHPIASPDAPLGATCGGASCNAEHCEDRPVFCINDQWVAFLSTATTIQRLRLTPALHNRRASAASDADLPWEPLPITPPIHDAHFFTYQGQVFALLQRDDPDRRLELQPLWPDQARRDPAQPTHLFSGPSAIHVERCALSGDTLGCIASLRSTSAKTRSQPAVLWISLNDQAPKPLAAGTASDAPALISQPISFTETSTETSSALPDWTFSLMDTWLHLSASARQRYCDGIDADADPDRVVICAALNNDFPGIDEPGHVTFLDLPDPFPLDHTPLHFLTDLRPLASLNQLQLAVNGLRVTLQRVPSPDHPSSFDWHIASATWHEVHWRLHQDDSLPAAGPRAAVIALSEAFLARCVPTADSGDDDDGDVLLFKDPLCAQVYPLVFYEHDGDEPSYYPLTRRYGDTIPVASYAAFLARAPVVLEKRGHFRVTFAFDEARARWEVQTIHDLSLKANSPAGQAVKQAVRSYCSPKPPNYDPKDQNNTLSLYDESFCHLIWQGVDMKMDSRVPTWWLTEADVVLSVDFGWCATYHLHLARKGKGLWVVLSIRQVSQCNGA